MRIGLLILILVLIGGLYAWAHNRPKTAASAVAANATTEPNPSSAGHQKIDFDTQIKPILQQRCQPCHFNGGVMYQRLPFDRPETIKTLGNKLFTRLKVERERELIRQFLAQ